MPTCCVYEYKNLETGAVEIWHVCKQAGGQCRQHGPRFRLLSSTPVPNCSQCRASGASAATSAEVCRQRIEQARQELEAWTQFLESGATTGA